MASKGKRRSEEAERFEQHDEDTVGNDNDEAGDDEDEKEEDELTLDDVLRLGGTKVKLRVPAATAAPFCLHVESWKSAQFNWSLDHS